MTKTLYIQPNAKRTGIIGEHGGHIKLAVKAPPVDGKANAEVIAFMAETLNIPKSAISIVRGETARLKTLSFDEKAVSVEALDKLLK